MLDYQDIISENSGHLGSFAKWPFRFSTGLRERCLGHRALNPVQHL